MHTNPLFFVYPAMPTSAMVLKRHEEPVLVPTTTVQGCTAPLCPNATLIAQGASQGCTSNLQGIPSPSKSPAHCTNLAADKALIPLELEIIFIVVTKFSKPFSTS